MCFAVMANIFLLEDDKILSKGISIALKKDEHTVVTAYGYLEALQKYQMGNMIYSCLTSICPMAAAWTFAGKSVKPLKYPWCF